MSQEEIGGYAQGVSATWTDSSNFWDWTKQQENTYQPKFYDNKYYPQPYNPWPQPCPGCGRCPVCGHRRESWWPPYITWSL